MMAEITESPSSVAGRAKFAASCATGIVMNSKVAVHPDSRPQIRAWQITLPISCHVVSCQCLAVSCLANVSPYQVMPVDYRDEGLTCGR